MSRGVAVLVGLLVLLSGCQGVLNDRTAQTVTPAPVPTASESATVNIDRLPQRHRAALSGQSYTVTVRMQVQYENDTRGHLTDQFAVGPAESYRYERRLQPPYPGPEENLTIWQNGSHGVVSETAENGTTTVYTQTSPGVGDLTLGTVLRGLLNGFDLSAERTDTGRLVSGSQDRTQNVPVPPELQNGTNATLEAEIRDDIVRNLTIQYHAEAPDLNQSVAVRLAFTIEAIGETTPTRPGWADERTATNGT